MIIRRNVEQEGYFGTGDDVLRTRMTTLTFVLLELFPFVLFVIDFVSTL